MEAAGRRHRGRPGCFQRDTFTAYLFRPNITLTGRYGRKKGKEKKEQAKLETHQNKNNCDSYGAVRARTHPAPLRRDARTLGGTHRPGAPGTRPERTASAREPVGARARNQLRACC